MAGLGFKDFAVGEVLTSADVDGYLMQQTVMRFADSAARGSALGTATGTAVALAEGMVTYLDDINSVQIYNGSGWTSAIRGIGSNVVEVIETAIFSASVAAGGTSSAAISASITPSSTTSKILVVANLSLASSTGGATATLYRDSSVSTFIGDASGSKRRVTNSGYTLSTASRSGSSVSVVYLDSPATTSSTTYDLRLGHDGASTNTVYMNRGPAFDDIAASGMTASSLTLIEVVA